MVKYFGGKTMNDIAVSIVCNAYNHGAYIKDALEGFVMQKTNFSYEVLVHDDASTDNTAELIRRYEKEYPEIIKPVYQTVNQYSQGVNITAAFHLPRMQGKYVAHCEGDDYWTDPLKLQKQYEALEAHPEVDICAHAANEIRSSDGKVIGVIAPGKKETLFTTAEVIAGGGGFVATNTLFYRRELLENLPPFRVYSGMDYAIQIHGALRGGMLYLPDNMAVYRKSVSGSWTDRMKASGYADKQRERLKTMLDMVNEETGGRYAETIRRAKLEADFASLDLAGRYKEMRTGELREVYRDQTLYWKTVQFTKEHFPHLRQLAHKIHEEIL